MENNNDSKIEIDLLKKSISSNSNANFGSNFPEIWLNKDFFSEDNSYKIKLFLDSWFLEYFFKKLLKSIDLLFFFKK